MRIQSCCWRWLRCEEANAGSRRDDGAEQADGRGANDAEVTQIGPL